MYFYFKPPLMPTEANIALTLQSMGYQPSEDIKQAQFGNHHLQLSEKHTDMLEFKHLLAQLISNHCPEVMPLTYQIDEQNAHDVCQQAPAHQHWILKPSLLNNGDGIKLFSDIDQVIDHFVSNQRYDGTHVLQQYIRQPHLLQGHKYSLRLFVVITNYTGCYLYPEGYFNVAKEAYAPNNYDNIAAHLTNEHLSHGVTPDSIQIPTIKAPHFDGIFKTLKTQIEKVIQGFEAEASGLYESDNTPRFSLFGFDFMLDEHLKPWLLEVNHCPCFPTDHNHVLHDHLYQRFWQAITEQFVLPIMQQKPAQASAPFIALTKI